MAKVARKNLNRNASADVKRFSDFILRMKGINVQGLAEAAILIKDESIERTPVDHGNLKASHYIEPGGTRDNPEVQVYLTADYAVYVHENLEAKHAVGEAKFLENAVLENRAEIVEIIKRRLTV